MIAWIAASALAAAPRSGAESCAAGDDPACLALGMERRASWAADAVRGLRGADTAPERQAEELLASDIAFRTACDRGFAPACAEAMPAADETLQVPPDSRFVTLPGGFPVAVSSRGIAWRGAAGLEGRPWEGGDLSRTPGAASTPTGLRIEGAIDGSKASILDLGPSGAQVRVLEAPTGTTWRRIALVPGDDRVVGIATPCPWGDGDCPAVGTPGGPPARLLTDLGVRLDGRVNAVSLAGDWVFGASGSRFARARIADPQAEDLDSRPGTSWGAEVAAAPDGTFVGGSVIWPVVGEPRTIFLGGNGSRTTWDPVRGGFWSDGPVGDTLVDPAGHVLASLLAAGARQSGRSWRTLPDTPGLDAPDWLARLGPLESPAATSHLPPTSAREPESCQVAIDAEGTADLSGAVAAVEPSDGAPAPVIDPAARRIAVEGGWERVLTVVLADGQAGSVPLRSCPRAVVVGSPVRGVRLVSPAGNPVVGAHAGLRVRASSPLRDLGLSGADGVASGVPVALREVSRVDVLARWPAADSFSIPVDGLGVQDGVVSVVVPDVLPIQTPESLGEVVFEEINDRSRQVHASGGSARVPVGVVPAVAWFLGERTWRATLRAGHPVAWEETPARTIDLVDEDGSPGAGWIVGVGARGGPTAGLVAGVLGRLTVPAAWGVDALSVVTRGQASIPAGDGPATVVVHGGVRTAWPPFRVRADPAGVKVVQVSPGFDALTVGTVLSAWGSERLAGTTPSAFEALLGASWAAWPDAAEVAGGGPIPIQISRSQPGSWSSELGRCATDDLVGDGMRGYPAAFCQGHPVAPIAPPPPIGDLATWLTGRWREEVPRNERIEAAFRDLPRVGAAGGLDAAWWKGIADPLAQVEVRALADRLLAECSSRGLDRSFSPSTERAPACVDQATTAIRASERIPEELWFSAVKGALSLRLGETGPPASSVEVGAGAVHAGFASSAADSGWLFVPVGDDLLMAADPTGEPRIFRRVPSPGG